LYSFGFKKNPKYISPSSNVFYEKGKTCLKSPFSPSESKKVVRMDFSLFMSILVALEKRFMMFFRVQASDMGPAMKISISSTKRRCVT
jgi:hypothetical protein